ncbi:MAG: hypothetical protein JSS02_35470, partial [Planctomycetes bacterium]|nr:hypothetical protein [Planctomycetota bacterium]
MRRSLRNLVVWSIVALGASSGPTVIAAEDPRANPAAAAPAAAAEPAAVKFTRSDLERWTAQAKVLTDAAAQAAAALEAANKAVADAKAALTAADKAIAEATAAITAAEPAKVATEKALVAAQEELKKVEAEKKDDADAINAAKTAVAAAQTAADTAAKQLAEAQAKKKQGEETKATATKQIPEFEAVIKPRTEAKAAADKLAAEAQVQIKTSQDRLTVLGQGKVQPDPTATRLIQTVTHDRPLLACKFDAAGQYLLAGAEDSLLHRWDLVTNSAVHLKGHRSWIGTMAPLNPTTSVLVTGGHEGKLAWWNALDPAPAPSRIIDAHKGYIRAVAVSPNGMLIATG